MADLNLPEHYGVDFLHTNTKWLEKVNTKFDANNFISSADYNILQDREQQLYKKFNTTTFKDFMKKIKSIIGNSKDRECIENFAADKLSKSIVRFAKARGSIFEQEIQLVFDSTKLSQTKLNFLFQNYNGRMTTKGKNLYINLTYTATQIKPLLNKLFGKNFWYNKNTLLNVDEYITKAILDNSNALFQINVATTKNGQTTYTEFVQSTIPNFPWGVVKADVDNAIAFGYKNDLYKELKKAEEAIKNFFINELCDESTEELKNAVKQVWQNHFLKKFSADLFFSGGKKSNFISGVLGSVGEFQSALIFQYLQNKINDNFYVKIIGNIYKKGEQLKSDVSILKSIGIQVKNYTFDGNTEAGKKIRDIHSTIHPADFNKYFSENEDSKDFLTFLANYYFNTSYQADHKQDLQSLKEYLGNYLAELMSLAVSEASNGTNSVTFYIINGRYLVPASHIIQAGSDSEEQLKKSIEITSGWKGLSDEDFNELTYTKIDDEKGPEWLNYWFKVNNVWFATEKNKKDFDILITKFISIRTTFNPENLLIKDYLLI